MFTKSTFCFVALVFMITGNAKSQDWSLTGNAGTNPATMFIGTTDNNAFKVRTNNTVRMTVTSGGKIRVGTGNPVFKFEVQNGSISVDSMYRINGVQALNRDASNRFQIGNATALVGIGTSLPVTPLHVNGIITAAGGNSTNWNTAFSWGNHATAGYLTQSGLTNNRITKWNGTAMVSSLLFDNGNRLGLGTTSPLFTFHVATSSELRSVYIENNTSSAGTTFGIYAGALGAGAGDKRGGSFDAIGGTGTNIGVRGYASGGTENFGGYFIGKGYFSDRLGIGTDAPSTYLHLATPNQNVAGLLCNIGYTGSVDLYAIDASSVTNPGFGIGVRGVGGYKGVEGIATPTTYTGSSWGGIFTNSGGTAGTHYGVLASASGSGTTNYGIHATASGGTTNWAGYFVGNTYISGDLRIGTTTPATGYKVSINGKVICTELRVELQSNWPDYVFTNEHELQSIEALDAFVKENKHLPGIPSAGCIRENGLHVGEMQTKLLEKIEEQALYIIQLNDKIKNLESRIESLIEKE
ncbi:MAG: hypothetical protein JNL47_05840 [Bacteroidia bacterium]|nr:hypothetical protein [Bacteroidia bacterium]